MPANVQHDHDMLARRIETLLRTDRYSSPLGIRLHDARPCYAELSMLVTPQAMNPHGSAHGGAVWTLADMAFGSAGYYDGPILTTESKLTFLRATPGGSRLYARATQISRHGRSGIFHIVMGTDLADDTAICAIGQFSGRWAGLPPLEPASYSPFATEAELDGDPA